MGNVNKNKDNFRNNHDNWAVRFYNESGNIYQKGFVKSK